MKIRDIVKKYVSEDRQHRIVEMLDHVLSDGKMRADLPEECFLDLAPCSTKYHGCNKGGLMQHSLRVTKNMLVLRKAMKSTITEESCVIVGLFHGLGKTGDSLKPYYIPQEDDWRRKKLGEQYCNNKAVTMPHHFLSLFILQEFGVKLSPEEHKAILCHNGLYTPAGQEVLHNEGELMMIAHFSDAWDAFIESKK